MLRPTKFTRRLCLIRALTCGRALLQPLPFLAAFFLAALLCRLIKMAVGSVVGDKTKEMQSLGLLVMKTVGRFILELFAALPSDSQELTMWIVIVVVLVALVVGVLGLLLYLAALLVDLLDWMLMSNSGQTVVVLAIVFVLCLLVRPLTTSWRTAWKTPTALENRHRQRLVADICHFVGVTTSSDIQRIIMEYRGNDIDSVVHISPTNDLDTSVLASPTNDEVGDNEAADAINTHSSRLHESDVINVYSSLRAPLL